MPNKGNPPEKRSQSCLWHGLQHSLQQNKAVMLIGVHNGHSPKQQIIDADQQWLLERAGRSRAQTGRMKSGCHSRALPSPAPRAQEEAQQRPGHRACSWRMINCGTAEKVLPCLKGFLCACATFSHVLGERRDIGGGHKSERHWQESPESSSEIRGIIQPR